MNSTVWNRPLLPFWAGTSKVGFLNDMMRMQKYLSRQNSQCACLLRQFESCPDILKLSVRSWSCPDSSKSVWIDELKSIRDILSRWKKVSANICRFWGWGWVQLGCVGREWGSRLAGRMLSCPSPPQSPSTTRSLNRVMHLSVQKREATKNPSQVAVGFSKMLPSAPSSTTKSFSRVTSLKTLYQTWAVKPNHPSRKSLKAVFNAFKAKTCLTLLWHIFKLFLWKTEGSL